MFELWHLLFASTLLSFIRVGWEYIKFDGTLTPLSMLIIFYFYFTFGPVIAHLLNIPIYTGINVTYLKESVVIFTVAITGLALTPSNLISRLHIPFEFKVNGLYIKRMRNYFSTLMWCSVIVILVIAIMNIGTSSLDKVERIKAVGGLHYPFITLWPIFSFCYMAVKPKIGKNFILCFFLYCTYCIYIGERDFVLILVSITIWWFKGKKISIVKFGIVILCGAIYFVFSSMGRGSLFEGGSLAAMLNQGSNLMVTSNVAAWLNGEVDYWLGGSYISSLINMITLGSVKIQEPLSIWFSQNYSSSVNDGAFGFALEAEALLNFGVVGVFFVFSIMSIMMSKCYINHTKGRVLGSLLTYFSVFYFIYAIRGESLMIFKGGIYCLIIFISGVIFAQRGKLIFRRLYES